MDLLLTAALPWPTILYTILIDEIMIVTGLVGALVASQYKWGYWFFGMLALFFIGYVLIIEARTSANFIGKDVGKTFLICGSWTVSGPTNPPPDLHDPSLTHCSSSFGASTQLHGESARAAT